MDGSINIVTSWAPYGAKDVCHTHPKTKAFIESLFIQILTNTFYFCTSYLSQFDNMSSLKKNREDIPIPAESTKNAEKDWE